ncbi:uncharacterized protein LOC143413453 [Maylandia zebra]|uniref:uncharacterized protein LOC143413453 n=1 Tax=Maylandia zebra TaxID=106582 RepID=UPI00403CFC63
MESVHLSEPKTLQCSLLSKDKNGKHQSPNEDKVHWFKGASESHPGSIYHGSIKNKEDGRCEYSFSETITNSPDAGMDYCALVTCGEILFGKRTKVEIEFPVVTVLGALLTCSVLVNFAMFTRLILSGENQCKGKVPVFNDVGQERSPANQINDEEGEEVELNYVALDFPSRKSSRWKSKNESPECTIYSGIGEGQ